MGTSAKYTLDIKDIAYVSDTVEMTVTLDRYVVDSYPDSIDVQNEEVSEITIPACYSATSFTMNHLAGATIYLPVNGTTAPSVVTADIPTGFQYAIATIVATVMNGNVDNVGLYELVTGQYSWDGAYWIDASWQAMIPVYPCFEYELSDASHEVVPNLTPLNHTFFIPGTPSTGKCYARWKCYNAESHPDGSYSWHDTAAAIEVIPRHTHVWQQSGEAEDTLVPTHVNNASYIGATPESITCNINGSTFAIACAAPTYANNLNIKGYLVTGVNTIEFTSTTPCRVTPSANYTALPVT